MFEGKDAAEQEVSRNKLNKLIYVYLSYTKRSKKRKKNIQKSMCYIYGLFIA